MQTEKTKIKIENVLGIDEQITVLYELLRKRMHKISHENIPEFDQHRDFVLNHPYVDWFILRNAEKPVGSFYTKYDNSVGINLVEQDVCCLATIIEHIRDKLKPQPTLPSEVPPYFFINVSHSNTKLQNMLEQEQLLPIQISYRL